MGVSARRLRAGCVTASGGVTCNSALRAELQKAASRQGLRLRIAERSLCTDNAGMIAALAEQKLMHGAVLTPATAEIKPSWQLA